MRASPRPRSVAMRRYGMDIGSKPMIFGRDRVDRDRIGAREHDIADDRIHRARSGAVAADGAVHDGEDVGMQLALHDQEIDEHLVNVLVRVMADLLEKAAEGVLDGARRDRMAVRLHRREMENVLSLEHGRDLDSLGEYLVELQQRLAEPVHLPFDLGERRETETVSSRERGATDCSTTPLRGFVTTVLFSMGSIWALRYPWPSRYRATPSSCHGWLEQAGKYFVHERLSLSRRSRCAVRCRGASARSIARPISSRTASGFVRTTATFDAISRNTPLRIATGSRSPSRPRGTPSPGSISR